MKQPVMGARWPRMVLLVAMVVSVFGAATSSPAQAGPRLQPALAAIAAQRPDQQFDVIVQMVGKDSSAQAVATRLGATLLKDLHIINAFEAQMSAHAAYELASLSGVRWISLNAPVAQSDGTMFTTWSTKLGTSTANGFNNNANIVDSTQGANGTYGYGSAVRGAFGGFEAEVAPDTTISRVELVLQAYVSNQLGPGEDPRITISISDTTGLQTGNTYTINHSSFNGVVGGPSSANTLYFDVTSTRNWQWSDFDNNLEVTLDQTRFNNNHYVYYDAIGLRVTSTAGTDASGGQAVTALPSNTYNGTTLGNAYNATVRATDVWNEAPTNYQGQGITVAVVDSGIAKNRDLDRRLIASVNFNHDYHRSTDAYWHGTFVSDVIAGDGTYSNGTYVGIAPKANVINVRVSDDQGCATEADVVSGMQWINDHRNRYNIKVVNLSLNSGSYESYLTSPLDAAAEILWFNGITVVVAAGNNGNSTLYAPANDPFVITVGATNDQGTTSMADDALAGYSAYGLTETGAVKPDLVAPGSNIIAYLPNNDRLTISQQHPANRVNNFYFKMSGTSTAAPMVSGAVALLLQANPNLTPDQVKYRLKATAVSNPLLFPGYNPLRAGAGYLDVYAALHSTTNLSANTNTIASSLLWTGNQPVSWGSVNWNSVNWNSVNWNSVNWNSVNWNSVNWNSDYWGQ